MPYDKRLIVHFGELWLRGRNRNHYIKALKRNISERLAGIPFKLEDKYDRLILTPGKKASMEDMKKRISTVFGISAYEVACIAAPDLNHISKAAVALLKESGVKSVKVKAHRAHKGFKFNSIDITKRLCKDIEGAGMVPTLEGYEKELFISVMKDAALVFMDRCRGSGGLPTGTSGKCVVLLSGGIDSPVAAWYAMKRGLTPIYLHVHALASNEDAKSSKISEIVDILSVYSQNPRCYYVPSHIFQMAALKSGRYELIMIKGFMLRLAEKIAEKEGAGAIVTGESLGQVASQTLPNIAAEEDGISIPILRPLIGFDKEEITKVAISIGTYGESIKPYKDACSINARNPVTNSSLESFKRIAKEINLNGTVKRSLQEALAENRP
ncbi:MAG: tRNA uracil 4-sulfurtransferase ThiI [Candidatus Micrarchaeaceae archaeon]